MILEVKNQSIKIEEKLDLLLSKEAKTVKNRSSSTDAKELKVNERLESVEESSSKSISDVTHK